jgi:hypothetical protein
VSHYRLHGLKPKLNSPQITPPVGFNLFVLQGMTGKQLPYIARCVHVHVCPDGEFSVADLFCAQHRDLAAHSDEALISSSDVSSSMIQPAPKGRVVHLGREGIMCSRM